MQLATAHDMRWTKGSVENRIIPTQRGQYITETRWKPNYNIKLLNEPRQTLQTVNNEPTHTKRH